MPSARFAQFFLAPRHRLPNRPGRIGANLRRERAHLLGLSAEDIELLAPIGCLQFDNLGEVPRSSQALGKIEAGIDVALGNIHDLEIECGSALADRVERALHSRHRGFERRL